MSDALPPDTVPLLDITPLRSGSSAERSALAAAVDRACCDIGFLAIRGHGIDPRLIREWFAVSREFFAQPEDYKRSLEPAPGDFHHGYHRFGGEYLAGTRGSLTPPDLREFYVVGRLSISDPYYTADTARRFYRPNYFPARPAAFEAVATRYYRAMEELGRDLMRLFACALGLGEHWFEDKIDRHFSALSTIWYPPQLQPPLPGQLRAGAHTDYGSLTILAPTEAPGGLQVRTQAGKWTDVPYVADAFVVNIGDMMARWTNDRWVSTMHRVVNPPVGTGERQSSAYFLHPNYDALVSCLPTCAGPSGETRYAPVRAGEHMWAMMNAIAPPGGAAEKIATGKGAA